MKRTLSILLSLCLLLCLFTPAAFAEKSMTIGDTTFNAENWEETIDPHRTYNGWPCIRYGVGETLVHYTDTMELEPWLATAWENDGSLTWTITLREGVKFSSGRDMDAAAVKQCFEHLLANHDRAPGDPQYFFTTSCLPGMSYNFGAYENEAVNAMIEELATEFDTAKRAELAVALQQAILDDNAYFFCSFLQMNMISKSNVSNWTAHACDYYEVTVDLDIN